MGAALDEPRASEERTSGRSCRTDAWFYGFEVAEQREARQPTSFKSNPIPVADGGHQADLVQQRSVARRSVGFPTLGLLYASGHPPDDLPAPR